MKNYQKLKEIIQKANPEIKKREILYRCNRVWDAWNYGTMTEDDFKKVNLSKNITLENCLQTYIFQLRKKDKQNNSSCCAVKFIQRTAGEIVCHWRLNKPLQDQSNETKQYLIDLLVK